MTTVIPESGVIILVKLLKSTDFQLQNKIRMTKGRVYELIFKKKNSLSGDDAKPNLSRTNLKQNQS